ncbi:MAG: hypothetical protein CMJ42_02505 [Phyllobacteriaceae bacterium]|nr:hypothetical protein [Phyllobacteriaceae bacterium]MBA93199.1 hypothetical protein [Phyllobacteriaceae bacterium]
MGRPARSLADDGFVAFSQDETRPASFVPLSVEQAPQAWEPLAGGAEQEPAVPPLAQARLDDDTAPPPGGFPDVASTADLPGLEPAHPGTEQIAAGSAMPADAEPGAGFVEGVPEDPGGAEPAPDAPVRSGAEGSSGDGAGAAGPASAADGADVPAEGNGEGAGSDGEDYGFVSAAAGAGEGEARRLAEARQLSAQLAAGLERISVELAEQLSVTVGRILEPVVSRTVRERMTDRFLKAALEALAMRPETPCRLEAPRDLVPLLRDDLERKGYAVTVAEGPMDGLTLRLDAEVLAVRFAGLAGLAGDLDDE